MAVVRYTDHHRVDLFFQLVEHFAKIDELPGARRILERLARSLLVDVAHGDDILARNALEVVSAAPADSNQGEVQLFIGRLRSRG